MKSVLVLCYYCEAEVNRYIRIGEVIKHLNPDKTDYTFVLSSVSTGIEDSKRLHDYFKDMGEVHSYRCSTQTIGYPYRCSAMFWETMEFVATLGELDGFAFWLESDMIPFRKDWLDRLEDEWKSRQSPLVVGIYSPEKYDNRKFSITKAHYNGGALYSPKLANHMPEIAKQRKVFDIEVSKYVIDKKAGFPTNLLKLSTEATFNEDEATSSAVVLHGYCTDKDRFIECVSDYVLFNKRPPQKEGTGQCCARSTRRFGVNYCILHTEYSLPWRLLDSVEILAFKIAREYKRTLARFLSKVKFPF